MAKRLNILLQKEMSRKDFLWTMGFGIISVMGLTAAIQALTGKPIMPAVLRDSQPAADGYGASPYGGVKNGV